jgi:hypothetical protein
MTPESPTPDREPPDDPAALHRPVTAAGHERFFEDGEEPPERYDLQDELDYILSNAVVWNERRWFQVARRHYRANWTAFMDQALATFGCLLLVGICSGGILSLLFEPFFRVFHVNRSLGLLVGRRDGFYPWVAVRKQVLRLLACRSPALICWLMAFISPFVVADMLTASADSGAYWLVTIFAFVFFAALATLVQIRLCGFAFELAYDHDLSPIDGFRGSWKLTAQHAWKFTGLRIRLWLFVALTGILTLGFGLLFTVPFAELVWLAAYLDIAGSEELLDIPYDQPKPTVLSARTP